MASRVTLSSWIRQMMRVSREARSAGWTWPANTRLLTRASAEYEGLAVAVRLRLFGHPHPVHFAMQRKQLLNVRRRAEVAAG
jgi:hypothetical protein